MLRSHMFPRTPKKISENAEKGSGRKVPRPINPFIRSLEFPNNTGGRELFQQERALYL